MKLTVKTLQQKAIQLDVDLSETVLDVKKKLNASEGFAIESQKLIFSGKILSDDQTLESLNIKESEFMVVMVTKPKPTAATSSTAASSSVSSTPTASTTSSTPASTNPPSTALTTSSTVTTSSTSSPTPITTTSPASTLAQAPLTGDPSFATGAAYETAVSNMVEMGFPREQVVHAMRAAYNNPDRAVDYLMNGIPENLEPRTMAPPPSMGSMGSADPPLPTSTTTGAAAPSTTSSASQNLFNLAQQQQQQQFAARQGGISGPASSFPTSPNSSGLGGSELSELAQTPQFDQLRQLVQANPQLMQPILQQMAQTHPQLMEYLSTHQDEFLNMLLSDPASSPLVSGSGGAMMPSMAGSDDEGMTPGTTTIHITEEEKNAIDRLVALGFERHIAIEAYFACDKNEEMAANYLFENQFD